MNDAMPIPSWFPSVFQSWLQYAFLLEVLQNLLQLLLLIVVFSLLYALLDLFLLCRQEYQAEQHTHKPGHHWFPPAVFKTIFHWPSRK